MFSGRLIRQRNIHHSYHRTSTNIHTNSGTIQTRLRHLISECVTDLKKIPVDRHLKSQIGKLDDRYRCKIHDEIKEEFDALADIFSPDDSSASKNRAQGWALISALQSTRHFLDNYEVTWPRMNLSAAINLRHFNELGESFRESFISLKQEDRCLLASVIAPSVFNDFGICLDVSEKFITNENYLQNQRQLNFNQVTALLDYTHYATGTFNGVNCGMRAFEYNRIRTIADVIYCVQQPLTEALTLLRQKNEFLFKGSLIKGIQINDPGGPLKRAKLQSGNILAIPHPTSTTSDPMKSYAQRGTHDGELVFLNGVGVKIHLFHNKLTTNEMEVLIPTEVVYQMIGPNAKYPKLNGSIERFYCQPLQATHWEPGPFEYA